MVTIITITNKIHIKEMNTITSLKTQTSQSPYTSISYSLSIKQLLTILRRAKIARHFPELQLMKATVARAIRHSLSPTSLEILQVFSIMNSLAVHYILPWRISGIGRKGKNVNYGAKPLLDK